MTASMLEPFQPFELPTLHGTGRRIRPAKAQRAAGTLNTHRRRTACGSGHQSLARYQSTE